MKRNGLGLLILFVAIGLLLISCGAPEGADKGVDLVEVMVAESAVPTPTLAPTKAPVSEESAAHPHIL